MNQNKAKVGRKRRSTRDSKEIEAAYQGCFLSAIKRSQYP